MSEVFVPELFFSFRMKAQVILQGRDRYVHFQKVSQVRLRETGLYLCSLVCVAITAAYLCDEVLVLQEVVLWFSVHLSCEGEDFRHNLNLSIWMPLCSWQTVKLWGNAVRRPHIKIIY